MPTLFDPIAIGRLTLPNRIVMAPMTRSRNDDAGVPTDIMATYYAQRASAGLIISEATYVSAAGKGYSRIPGLHTDAQVEGWKKVTAAVHGGGGRIFAQLFHTGRVAVPPLLPPGVQPVAPSAVAINGKNYTDFGPIDYVVPRALETDEVSAIAAEFGEATRRALAAGFDGVELHSASGYLTHQFLDASINQRSDRYGGSVANRLRFPLETIDAMISVAGADRVGIKVSPRIKFNDIVEPDADELYPQYARELSARKIAYFHAAQQGAYAVHDLVRPIFKGPYLAGAGLDQAKAEALIAGGGADAAVFGKWFVSNPDLPRRFRETIPLSEGDTKTHYSKGPAGYIDYPVA